MTDKMDIVTRAGHDSGGRARYGKLFQVLPFVALSTLFSVAHAEEATLTTTLGLDYSSGKYGSTARTDILYAPLVLKYSRGPALLKLTVPYLSITSPSGGTLIGVDENGLPIYSGAGARVTESGMGDVVFSYIHSVVEDSKGGFLLDLGAKVKFATADENKGLGTGEQDYAVFVDFYYLAGAATPFATLGYKVLGDPAGLKLRDVWQSTLGLSYKLSGPDTVGAMWDFRQPTQSAGDPVNELTAYWVHKFGPDWKVQSYAVTGFSDASPDIGLGVMFSANW